MSINTIDSNENKSSGGGRVTAIYRQNTAKAIRVEHFTSSDNIAARFLRKKTKEDHQLAMTGNM